MERIDAILIENIQAGDREALASLVEKHKQLVYRVAYRITRNHEDAGDVFQETFIKVSQSISRFRSDSSFETWLYRIVVNLSLNALKKADRRRKHQAASSKEFPRCSPEDPHQALERKELESQIRQAMDRLSADHRSVIVLHELEGLTHREIGEVLGCAEGTVRSRLHHARRRLRCLLSKYIE